MINILYILIEQGVFELDKTFYYYYESPISIQKGTRVLVNFHNRELVGFVMNSEVYDKPLDQIENDFKGIKPIIELIDETSIISEELFEVALFMSKRYVSPLISCFQSILPRSLRPASSSKNAAKPQYFSVLYYKHDVDGLTKKQLEVLNYIKENQPVLKNTVSSSIVNKLIEKDAIRVDFIEKVKELQTFSNNTFENFELTDAQNKVYEGILNTDKQTSLIYGVTGSGKTEIYIKLIEDTLKNGRTAVFLVPEINLTPYFCDKLNFYFKNKVSILTSGLSDAQRYGEYRKIIRKESQIVIGTRSAIFAPLENLGLIIIDEEFNDNYKQDDEQPHYHAIDIAKFRCTKNNAKLVLGSATPSIETMAKAKSGQYSLFELKERYNCEKLPNAKLINMSNIDNLYPGYSFLSNDLVYAMKVAIMNNKKILLLLNRKGYSTISVCDECYKTLLCDKCSHPYTYHKYNHTYKCNVCGRTISANDALCECGNNSFVNMGFGVEALETALNKIFPNEKILRLDTNIAAKPQQIAEILNEFGKDDNHILIGTEMIAKGHDFGEVEVVGIINIDQMLTLPFYNINERVFQLITQCIGRAGRNGSTGRAYIQTNTTNSYAIQIGCMQDYDLFFEKELEYRKLLENPPFFYVTTLKFTAEDSTLLRNTVYSIHNQIKDKISDYIERSYVSKITSSTNGSYTLSIVLKYKKQKEILRFCRDFALSFKNKSGITLKIFVDPFNF